MFAGRNRWIAGLARNASVCLERVSLSAAGAFLVVNVALILLSVIIRYVLRSSLMWTEELARYYLIYAVIIGAGALSGILCLGDLSLLKVMAQQFFGRMDVFSLMAIRLYILAW